MRRAVVVISMVLALVVFLAPDSYSFTYSFQSRDNSGTYSDMDDLDHDYYYSWRIKWQLPSNQHIVGATLTFANIYDWRVETDRLYIHLLNNPPALSTKIRTYNAGTYETTLWRGYDNEGGGDKFSGQGVRLDPVWNDPLGGSPRGLNLIYDLAHLGGTISPATGAIIPGTLDILDTLTAYIVNDGKFGFGIDPDCHYYNNGITLTITTAPVPEPSTLFLVGAGLAGIGLARGLRSRRSR